MLSAMRRRNFAASMVVTFSLAGCEKTTTSGNPPPPDPTAAEEPTSNPPGPMGEEGDGGDGESAGDGEPDVSGVQSKEQIIDNGDGTCSRIYDIDCPPNVACNPPPPEPVPCPDEG